MNSRSRAGLSQFFNFSHFGSRFRGPDLSFSRWQRCYKSRKSPVYLASEVQKRSNAPVPGQTLATKASKSCAIPPYVPGVNPLGWSLISALNLCNSACNSVDKQRKNWIKLMHLSMSSWWGVGGSGA